MRAITRRTLTVLIASACAVTLVAASACSGSSAGTTESTAMVVSQGQGRLLFVDQDTQEPYVPTIPEGGAYGVDGAPIAAEDLTVGNIVRVTGTGTMTRSYPAQYTGITRVQVTSEGMPADASCYQGVVESIFQTRDEDVPPFGWLDYRTSDSLVTLTLEPAGYEWRRGNAEVSFMDSLLAPDMVTASADKLSDATVDGPCEATLSFEDGATEVVASRWSEADVAAGTAPADGEAVPASLSDGVVTLNVEPGWRYLVTATFERGTASYAFVIK